MARMRMCAVQRKLLEYLKEKPWRSGCGFIYNNSQQTLRVLDSLCKKGLATKTEDKGRYQVLGDYVYTITPNGIKVANGEKMLGESCSNG